MLAWQMFNLNMVVFRLFVLQLLRFVFAWGLLQLNSRALRL